MQRPRSSIRLALCLLALPTWLACSDPAGEEESEAASGSETDGGDGDGDDPSTTATSPTAGDGDGDEPTSGDGDGDGDADTCEPDPPLAETLEGELSELAEPTPEFSCNLLDGDGPGFNAGYLAPGGSSTLDFVDVGSDGLVYAAGSVGNEGLLLSVELGNNPNNNSAWARQWSYTAGPGAVRGMVAEFDRVWLSTAPEHLLAIAYDGTLAEGPLEPVMPGLAYISALHAGANQLLVGATDRGGPPTCLGPTRVQLADPGSGAALDTTEGSFTTRPYGIGSDGSGGLWLATLDLNGQGVTITNIDADGIKGVEIPVSNDDAFAIGGDFAVASNGDPILALRGPFIIELYRFNPDGSEQWMITLPALGTEYNPDPHIDLDASDTISLAIDVDTSLGFAQVDGGGNVGALSRWDCGAPLVVTDLAVSPNGSDIWVSGVQDGRGFLASYQ